ncbi:hypothetical protein Q8A67_015918 [Cirrhinus molitorella]|uniref:Uncharacterized protein n=1 Tax=Cirrhinus molitorella TaxID=172907 RepID=A0AA88TKJ1_9TELE|nr:hypothetical protein Q8A67_015918 [Cirrhinus molitorella]
MQHMFCSSAETHRRACSRAVIVSKSNPRHPQGCAFVFQLPANMADSSDRRFDNSARRLASKRGSHLDLPVCFGHAECIICDTSPIKRRLGDGDGGDLGQTVGGYQDVYMEMFEEHMPDRVCIFHPLHLQTYAYATSPGPSGGWDNEIARATQTSADCTTLTLRQSLHLSETHQGSAKQLCLPPSSSDPDTRYERTRLIKSPSTSVMERSG